MASVTFKRGTKAEIESTQIQDGQLLMETDQLNNNKIYLDLPNGTRVPVGGSGAWVGTQEEFELAVEEGKIADGTQVIITDDYESGITASMTLYSNAQSGLVATNVQSAIDEVSAKIGQENISQVGNSVTGAINNLNSNLSKANQGVGAISSSGIQDDRFTIPSGAFSFIPFSIDRKNTNTDVFTSADRLGCLIKQSGLYSVRVKLHMYLVKDHNVDIRIVRYQQGEEISVERITIIGNNEQYHEDRTFILEHNASGNDRFNVQIMSNGSDDFIYGASEAADSVLEVIKIANV